MSGGFQKIKIYSITCIESCIRFDLKARAEQISTLSKEQIYEIT